MTNRNRIPTLSNPARVTTLLLLALGMAACGSMPKSEAPLENKTAATETGTAETLAQAEASTPAPAETAAPSNDAAVAAPADAVVAEAKPPTIVESCKDEPYVKYEKQARDSIAKGLAATEAGSYGVGFRDRDEHKKWATTHTQLFDKVNTSCQTLSDCAKKNPKDKEAKCVEQAKTFTAWQELAAQFAEKAKLVENTLPPLICSFEPSLDDAAHCFHDLAANVDKACDNAACKELSKCWNDVGYLDTAITQAERSCGFVHESLKTCRGYVEATGRRAKKFEQCKTMQDKRHISVIPAL